MKKITPYSKNLCSRNAEKMISIKLTSICNARCSFCVDRGGYTPKIKNDCGGNNHSWSFLFNRFEISDGSGNEISVPDVDAIVNSANKYKDYKKKGKNLLITALKLLMKI